MNLQFFFLKMSALFLIISSCNQEKRPIDNVLNTVKELTTPESQSAYLEKIYDVDQQVRNERTRILEELGYETAEYKESGEKMIRTDKENLAKIEAFLSIHGHPSKENHSKKAVGTPWLVIHHSPGPGGFEIRKRNFKYIFAAFQNNEIDGGALTFYLNRMYQIKFGRRLILKGPYKESFEIDTLINAMGLYEF